MKIEDFSQLVSSITVVTKLPDGRVQTITGEAYVSSLRFEAPSPERLGEWGFGELVGTGPISVTITGVPFDPNLKLWCGATDSTPQRGLIVAATSQRQALQFLNRARHFVTPHRFRNHWFSVGHLEHYRAIATEEGVWIGQAGHTHLPDQKWNRVKLMVITDEPSD